MPNVLQTAEEEPNYKRPPIKVRSFEVESKIDSSQFERLTPAWLQHVLASQSYPRQQLQQRWDFFIRENKKGVPVPKGVLTNVPRLYEESANGRLSRSIDVYPPKEDDTAKLIFTLYRPTKSVTRYTQLRNEVTRWLFSWMENYHSAGLGGIRLRYDNELTPTEYPSFWGERGLELGRILNFFSQNPAPTGKFSPPFRTELNLIVDESGPTYMRTELVSNPPEKGFRVSFEYISTRKIFNRSAQDCLADMDHGHGLILDHFEKHFSKEALAAFK